MSAFDKIIGYELIKEELKQIADCLKHTDKYRKMGVSIPRGLLLEGRPGVGKTLMATCLVEESGRRAFICRKDTSDGSFIKQIRETFEQAEENAPSIVVLDDMDKFADADRHNSYAEEYVTVQSCIDRIKGKDVFVIATVNDTNRVTESLIRHGRFDIALRIELPDISDTEQIIGHYLSLNPKVDADTRIVTEILSGKTSATLETVINEAGILACFEGSDTITTEHIIKAVLRTIYHVKIPADMRSLRKIDLRDYHHDSETIYHEAGHAVMSELLKPGTVALIAAFCEDKYGSFTKQIKNCKYHEITEDEADILISLAGKAAVEVRYGTPGVGGMMDYRSAYFSLRELFVHEAVYGFDLIGGTVSKKDSEINMYHQHMVISHRIAEYYQQAKKLLTDNRSLLDGIAEALSEKRYLTGDEIRQIKNGIHTIKEAS